ncbi:MAG: hypothetical protein WC800_04580 [Candidatus Nanopelagicaceae bacterium]|jgi:hypothetical protein
MKLKRPKERSYRGIWKVGVVLLAIALVGIYLSGDRSGDKKIFVQIIEKVDPKSNWPSTDYPPCPKDLAGILTAPLMEPKYISTLTPLGNINPPGHTSPVDHIYFSTNYASKIPLLAPADATITNLTEILKADSFGKYQPTGYVVRYVVCDGLVLDFASYTSLIKPLQDELASKTPDCVYGIVKPGHTGGPEGQCYYNVKYKVKSGEKIGWVQAIRNGQSLDLPFEIWAANYNKPARPDVNWDFYNDDRYAHSMCTFDLYSGDLKDQFYAKFGQMVNSDSKKKDPKSSGPVIFKPRTIEPICGQVNQNIVGTIQGMWYAGTSVEMDLESQGKGLAFLHNNFDPSVGEISIGGTITEKAGLLEFEPTHSGTINREPSEVKADGEVYCYDAAPNEWMLGGRVLVQLVDEIQLKAEHQLEKCTGQESFLSPITYRR